MDAKTILNYISEEKLNELAARTKVNHQVKKLDGATMFRLICYTMLNTKKTSLRIMETFYSSLTFKNLCNKDIDSVKYNSLSDRISHINVNFFQQIFEESHTKFEQHFKSEDSNILRFDSTLIGLSSKLINSEMKVGPKNNTKRQIKFTVGLKDIPVATHFFNKSTYMSEDVALKEAIFSSPYSRKNTVVFDRGLSAAKAFDELSESSISFVTRSQSHIHREVIESFEVRENQKNEFLEIQQDCLITLNKRRKTKMPLRYIEAKVFAKNKTIGFLTNIMDLEAIEIAQIYKKRWEIEVFFKFLKQDFGFADLVSRSENGIRVMMYITLTLAIFLTVYKKLNKLRGFKIAKLKFAQELETEIIKDIVLLCGGNPQLIPQYKT